MTRVAKALSTVRKMVAIEVSPQDMEDVREQGQAGVESYEYRGERDDRQPWEWHQGKRLLDLARRMELALKQGAKRR